MSSLSARSSVYKIGGLTILYGLLLCPARAHAQDAAPLGAPPADATPALTPAVAPATISPEVAKRLDELEARAQADEAKLAALQVAPSSDAHVTTGQRGFTIGNTSRDFELKLQGLVQADGRRIFGSDDPVLRDKTDTFLVRRARLYFDATVLGLVDARIMPDFGNNTTALLDAYADIHPTAWLRLRAGKFKPPVGLERLQTDAYVTLPERALDSNLSAQRDVGAELWGDIANAAIHYELAWLNGNPDGGLQDVDDEHAKTYGGRLFLRPFQLGDLRPFGDLGFGLAAESGNEKGSNAVTSGAAANTWLPSFKSYSQNAIFTYASSGTDATQTAYASHHHTRINPQLYYYFGPVGLLAEWVHEYQQIQRGALLGAVNNQAGHVTVSYAIGGDNSYEGVRPHAPVNLTTKELGALELVVRYGWLDLDDLAFKNKFYADNTKSVSEAKEWTFGANWWLNRNAKLYASYGHTSFVQGAAGAANRPTENVGIARVQMAF
ncbi:MAG TPA: porin [Polyangia bacterium]|jgi:phosphate-selective porin OprO/OprP|nr:porin [Polyangia bacterium]